MPARVELAEAVTRATRLKDRLRDEERQLRAWSQILLGRDVRHEHRHVLLPSAQPSRSTGQREEPVVLPKRLSHLATLRADLLPADPRRVADYVVEPCSSEERRESVAQQPGPDAVAAFGLQR